MRYAGKFWIIATFYDCFDGVQFNTIRRNAGLTVQKIEEPDTFHLDRDVRSLKAILSEEARIEFGPEPAVVCVGFPLGGRYTRRFCEQLLAAATASNPETAS